MTRAAPDSTLVTANGLNIAADTAAMAKAIRLVLGGSAHVCAVTFGLACLVIQVFVSYLTCVRFLKWLTLAPPACVAVAIRWVGTSSAGVCAGEDGWPQR